MKSWYLWLRRKLAFSNWGMYLFMVDTIYIHIYIYIYVYIYRERERERERERQRKMNVNIYIYIYEVRMNVVFDILNIYLRQHIKIIPLVIIHVLDMALNSIWWWGSNPGALKNMEYLFIVITPQSTLIWVDVLVRVPSINQTGLFNRLLRITIFTECKLFLLDRNT